MASESGGVRIPGDVTSASVFVQIGNADVEAGRLYSHRRRGSESASFAYADSYLANPGAYPLDPALPLLSGLQQTPDRQRIFGAFSDSCPDRWGQRLIERAERRRAASAGTATRSLGAFDLLLRVRDDLRQGAIRYSLGDKFVDDEVTGVPAMTDLPALLTASDEVASDATDDLSLNLLLRAGSSLGGARPKAHVRDTNGKIAIAKFPSPTDEWNVMAWEKTALDLAASAGITVPESSLHSIAGRSVLVVDRFDRTTEHQRRGYMSAMTALEATDGDTRSYTDIAEVIEEKSLNVGAELIQLWRRVAFSIMISNTDDHLRNHAFLHEQGDSWSLSPAFDLNPNPAAGPKFLSTAISDDTAADVDDLLAVASLFRLSDDDALTVLHDVVSAVAKWRPSAARHGLGTAAQDKMSPAFDHQQADRAARLLGG